MVAIELHKLRAQAVIKAMQRVLEPRIQGDISGVAEGASEKG